MTDDILLTNCPICNRGLYPNLLFEKSGAKYCPEDGDFFIQRLRGQEPSVVYRRFDQDPSIEFVPSLLEEEVTVRNRAGRPGITVQCDQTGVIFSSVKDVQEAMGFWASNVFKHLAGEQPSVCGYTFTRLESYSDASDVRKPMVKIVPSRANPIRCNQTGETFVSVRQACITMGLYRPYMNEHLLGKRDEVNGFTFAYIAREDL